MKSVKNSASFSVTQAHRGYSRIQVTGMIFSVTQAHRGYSRIQVTGMIEWGKKSKPPKIPWASNKTPKNRWTKIYPPENPMPNFRAIIKISRKHIMIWHENSNISFKYPIKLSLVVTPCWRAPETAKQLSMASIPLCFEFFRCRVDVLQS